MAVCCWESNRRVRGASDGARWYPRASVGFHRLRGKDEFVGQHVAVGFHTSLHNLAPLAQTFHGRPDGVSLIDGKFHERHFVEYGAPAQNMFDSMGRLDNARDSGATALPPRGATVLGGDLLKSLDAPFLKFGGANEAFLHGGWQAQHRAQVRHAQRLGVDKAWESAHEFVDRHGAPECRGAEWQFGMRDEFAKRPVLATSALEFFEVAVEHSLHDEGSNIEHE